MKKYLIKFGLLGTLTFLVFFVYFYKTSGKFRQSIISAFVALTVLFSSQQPAHSAGQADAFTQQNQQHQSRPQNQGIFSRKSNNDGPGPGKPNGNGSDGDDGGIPKYPKTESIEETQRHLSNIDEQIHKLVYVKKLKYTNKSLTSEFRRYRFPLRDFLNYNNLTSNYYQVKKLKTFFDLVKTNFVIESFSNKYYRMLVTVPEVSVYKSEQNILMVEIWIAEELFNYLHPFLFSDIFQQKLTKHQFQVLFEIIKTYSSIHLRKEFNITQFLDNYPSILSNQHKRQIQEYFIQYLKVLHQEGKLQDKVLDLSSNKVLTITDLNSSYSQIAVFENINVQFL